MGRNVGGSLIKERGTTKMIDDSEGVEENKQLKREAKTLERDKQLRRTIASSGFFLPAQHSRVVL